MKRCTKCLEIKPFSEFYSDFRASDQCQTRCKPCFQAAKANWPKNNREAKRRISRESNRRRRKQIQQASNRRRLTDPAYRIAVNLRRRLIHALNGENKSQSTIALLGCSPDDFVRWLESKFEHWMSWENYGTEWNIDHIRPCASFDMSSPAQQAECFHFTNCRPLRCLDNIKKGDKVEA